MPGATAWPTWSTTLRSLPQTVFHVASVSKQFTAFGIVLLAEQGKLGLDDDIGMYLRRGPRLRPADHDPAAHPPHERPSRSVGPARDGRLADG